MSVLLPNARLGVARRGERSVGGHGQRLPGALGAVEGPWPGYARETADGMWTLGLDIAAWPVRQHDVVVADDGRSWTVDGSQAIRHPVDSTVDWVRVTARERIDGGTEPGGAQFVGRGQAAT